MTRCTFVLALAGLLSVLFVPSADADLYSDNVLSLNPVSFWRLGESSGTTAFDETTLQNGVYHNVSLGQPGSLDSSTNTSIYNYPGYVEIAHNDAYLLDSGTILFSFSDLNSIRFAGLFSKDSTGYDSGGHLSLFTTADGRIQTRLQSTSDSYFVESDPFIQLDTWYDVAFTFGDAGMDLYINGMLVDHNDYTGGLGTTSGGIGNYEPIVLGANSWNSGNLSATPLKDYFSGMIDEMAIFDRALTEEEIGDLHTSKTVPEPTAATLVFLGLVLATATRDRRRTKRSGR